jgi:hypothetical protein
MIENSENIVVEINQRTKIDEGSANIETWSPLKDGKIFRSYLESKDKISDKDKKKLEDDTVYLLGRCINPKKIKETNLQNLGVEYPSQNKEVREKVKATNLEKYKEWIAN